MVEELKIYKSEFSPDAVKKFERAFVIFLVFAIVYLILLVVSFMVSGFDIFLLIVFLIIMGLAVFFGIETSALQRIKYELRKDKLCLRGGIFKREINYSSISEIYRVYSSPPPSKPGQCSTSAYLFTGTSGISPGFVSLNLIVIKTKDGKAYAITPKEVDPFVEDLKTRWQDAMKPQKRAAQEKAGDEKVQGDKKEDEDTVRMIKEVPETKAKKFCPSCGKEVDEGDNFCPWCGTKLAE